MAGIGFELRKILERNNYTSTLQAYFYAGIISSGPWVLSIVSMLLVGIISLKRFSDTQELSYFLVTVTYLMAGSLVMTGGTQLLLTRFIADRLYEKRNDLILPNTMGALALTAIIAALAAGPAVSLLFPDKNLYFRLLTFTAFVTLNCLWLAVIFLSGLKAYNRILLTMAIGYTTVVILSALLSDYQAEGLMLAFVVGHAFILFAFMNEIFRTFPGDKLLGFDFLKRCNIHPSLFFIGLAFYLGIWSDKFIFWFNPITSEATAGYLRSSVIYDIPIFLAYLTIIPGMAVFLVRFETDFAENYSRFYDAIREHQPLETIQYNKQLMVNSVRQGILEILKVQSLTVILLFVWTRELLSWLGISYYYETLLQVDMVGVGIQVIMMAVMNVLFYLDRRKEALQLSLVFLGSNTLFTLASQKTNPAFFGYGFVIGVTLTTIIGLLMINRILRDLEYETFMLRN